MVVAEIRISGTHTPDALRHPEITTESLHTGTHLPSEAILTLGMEGATDPAVVALHPAATMTKKLPVPVSTCIKPIQDLLCCCKVLLCCCKVKLKAVGMCMFPRMCA